jgi:hypothetical protein
MAADDNLSGAGVDGGFTFDTTNHWDGQHRTVSAYDANTTVATDSAAGIRVTKTGGADSAYNAAACNAAPLNGDFEIWFQRIDNGNYFVGVDAAPAASPTYTDIDFAVSFGGGAGSAYKNGVKDAGSDFSWSSALNWFCLKRVGSVLAIYENTTRAIAGAILHWTISSGSSAPMYVKTVSYKLNTSFRLLIQDVALRGTGLVQADPLRAAYVAPASDLTGLAGAWVRGDGRTLQPEWFGAKGDGVTNDTDAFYAASVLLGALNGGTLWLTSGKTYIVGKQTLGGDPANYSYAPSKIVYLSGFTGNVKIDGNGATLKAAPGLRFGSFDPTTGSVYNPTLPFSNTAYLATPYVGMIDAENFSAGSLEINDLTLDGNVTNLALGGFWGDTGYQVINAGMQITSTPGAVILRNVRTINHGTDGMTYRANIPAKGTPAVPFYALNCKFEWNGRQGASVTGGRGMVFESCGFNHTGMNGVVNSNPHAGIDIEPDGGMYARDIEFNRCEFLNNAGVGYGGGSGRIQEISFYSCRFSGDNSFCVTVFKPGHIFRDCTFAGLIQDTSVTNFNYQYEEGRGSQYIDCVFTDNPAWTYNGTTIYGNGAADQVAGNVGFERCTWDRDSGNLLLPGVPSTESVTMHDCTLTSSLTGVHQTNGVTFTGKTVLGNASLDVGATSDKFFGRYVKNGVEQFSGSKTFDWPSIAAGASSSTTVTCPRATTTDGRHYQAAMSVGWGGLIAFCEVTAANTVTVTAFNPTGSAIDLASGTLSVTGTK